MKTHLAVIQNENAQFEALQGRKPVEFVWNKDFTSFRVVQLRWWDDASYIAYQCGDDCPGYEEECSEPNAISVTEEPFFKMSDDEIPF